MPDINISFRWGVDTCNAPNIQYSQTYRNQQTVGGITYYDCSSFVWYALKAGGWDVAGQAYNTATGYSYSGNAITTPDEVAWLLALGFTEVSQSQVLAGDVCWKSGHTEMVYDPATGQTMGAHRHYRDDPDRDVSITSYDGVSGFTRFFTAGGASGGYGYSSYVIAALCGNCWQESTINPMGVETGGTGFGLFQWSNTATSNRRTAFESWCLSNGYDKNDGYVQLQYLIYEDFWIPKAQFPEFQSLSDWLNSTSTDIAYLTEAFMRCWEIPNEAYANLANRIQKANLCYNYFLTNAQDSSITEWKTTPNYLSESDSLNNAILIYRYFSAGGGGGGTPGEEVKNMPIWMYQRKRGLRVQWR